MYSKIKHLVVTMTMLLASNPGWGASLATLTIHPLSTQTEYVAEGVVEAVKSSVIAAQVTGSVTVLTVKSGDRVKPGQVLVKIDTRLATQQNLVNQSSVAAAQADLAEAKSEYERKQRLFEKHYISQAAWERAEANYKTAEARLKAQQAQTGVSTVQAGLHVLTAPYAGVVSEVMTEVGSMVMPDKPLLTLYQPDALRVVANIPQGELARLQGQATLHIDVPGVKNGEQSVAGSAMTILPTADAVSHVVQVRIALPEHVAGMAPGMFARVRFPLAATASTQQLLIPANALIRRSELTAVYVLGQDGKPQLRQVRVGRQSGDNLEVFSGLNAGDRLILDPLAAARAQ
jgi:multidrug efflux system membrane fusion protein